ncbi:MAG: hypothetical protein KA974_05450 [Saprospiraceae bacterium]|nr:hypothetical protein [Saprospiraceae bacterium]MBP7679619.1 hypothetical protein [Saprospiraceae bacterium]
MACSGCSVSKSGGCGSNGSCNNGCASGGCNRLNTFDWLATLELDDINTYDKVEVSFKNGSRKDFFINPKATRAQTGDMVITESDGGFDIGHISLSGELVRLQMKKKQVREDSVQLRIVRRANERDLERLDEARREEQPTMVRARAITQMLNLDMKIGDVEYRADNRKATFYYTADGRVDFRELIRHFAKEFKVKIEMRQIGARQESARIGGLGSCGRELCCSTWLTDFRSVSTTAARYQNLAINQAKLSGQCGRLKCCLNYELDVYIDALKEFPEDMDRFPTQAGMATLMKTDIFKRVLYYAYEHEHGRGKFYPIDLEQIIELKEMLNNKELPVDLAELEVALDEEDAVDYEDVTGAIELPDEKRKKRRKKKKPLRDKSGNTKDVAENNNKPPQDATRTTQKPPRDGQRRSNPKSESQRGEERRQNSQDNRNRQQQPPQATPNLPNTGSPKNEANSTTNNSNDQSPNPNRNNKKRYNQKRQNRGGNNNDGNNNKE